MRSDRPVHPAFVAIAFALCVAASSLRNGFALDDVYVIAKNDRVHSLEAPWRFLAQTYWPPDRGSALYRPLTILGFALQWAAGGGSPVVFHAVSVLLFAGVSALVAGLALKLELGRPAALLAGALFAVHPVHVEAVANVVGQSELLAALGVLGAVLLYVRGRRRGSLTRGEVAGIVVLYAIGCFSKEHATVLPVVLIILEYACFPGLPFRERCRQAGPVMAGLLAMAVAFWTARTAVLGGLVGADTHPALRGVPAWPRLLTSLGLVPTWVRLLLFPWRLRADYSPAEFTVAHVVGEWQLLGLALLAGLGFVVWRSWRPRPVVAAGVLFAAITLGPTSNVLVPTGILLSERSLFLPSAGVVLALAAALGPLLTGPPRRWIVGLTAVVVVLWTVRFALRVPAWASSEALSERMLTDAPRDYRSWWMVGGFALDRGERQEAKAAMRKAVQLYDGDPNLLLELGNLELVDAGYPRAEALYRRALTLAPGLQPARSRRILALVGMGRCAEARDEARAAGEHGDPQWRSRLAFVDSVAASPGAHCDTSSPAPAGP